jgi:DNA modification methylase
LHSFSNHPNIEMADPATLTIAPGHARKNPPRQVEQIARSIDRFGNIVPIIVDADNVVAAGVGRLKAALLRKLELVPVIRVNFVSEVERRAFALADNRLAELSEWDEAALKDELEYLFKEEFDISETGFNLTDLDLGAGLLDEPEPPFVAVSEDGKAVTRRGDLWHVGEHRLYCGNAREGVSYDTLLGDERAAMVFSDPPFNVAVQGHISKQAHFREFAEAAGEMSPPEFTTFLRTAFRHCVRFSVDGSIHFHCMDWRHIREILDAADGIYTEFKQLVTWVKPAGSLGTFYRSRHELIFVFKSGRAKHTNNFGLGDTGRYRTNVWEVAHGSTRKADLKVHPTVKPVALVADALLDCSNRGDLILDPFSGVGTVLLACARTNRRGAAIEIDAQYVDATLERLRKTTGLQAVHADGRTFEDVAAARAAEEKVDD